MDFGPVRTILSSKLHEAVVVYSCMNKPGFVLKFYRQKENEYRCCRCKELGKYRTIKVVNARVVGRKSPEVDHHPDCEPLPESSALALEVDRGMRQNVREHGKRPREAYNEMMTHVAKRFKSSEQQVCILPIRVWLQSLSVYER